MISTLRDISIEKKVTAAVVLVSAVALGIFGVTFLMSEASLVRENLLRDLGVEAEVLSRGCAAALVFDDSEAASETISCLEADSRVLGAVLRDSEGEVLAEYQAAADSEPRAGPQPHRSDPVGAFIVERPVLFEGKQIGWISLSVDSEPLKELLGTRVRFVLLVAVVALSTVVVIARWILRFLFRPTTRLIQTVRAITTTRDFTLRAPKHRNDELGHLVDCINDMLGEIERGTEELVGKNSELSVAMTRAQDAARAKSQFLANMSHEIRTPLNAIIGMTDYTLLDEKDPDRRECLETVLSSGESLLSLVNEVLDFSQIEAGKTMITPQPFRLRETVSIVSRMLSLRAEEQGLRLRVHVEENFADRRLGDESRVRQVLINLVGNAVKFTDSGGVEIRVGRDTSDNEDRVRFEVRDTGIGIPKEKLGTVFHAFEQVDDSHTRRHGGTGLGLAISQHLVALMGGAKIHVESEEGRGSTFSFSLPLPEDVRETEGDAENNGSSVAVRSAAQDGAKRRAYSIPSLRILLAEDNVTNRLLACRLLEREGHQIVVAENGKRAVELFEIEEFDLILMDIQMPEMDGLEATARIRELQNSGSMRCPIIALTAHAMKREHESFLRKGVDDCVAKPFRIHELYAAIKRALGKEGPFAGLDGTDINRPTSTG